MCHEVPAVEGGILVVVVVEDFERVVLYLAFALLSLVHCLQLVYNTVNAWILADAPRVVMHHYPGIETFSPTLRLRAATL